MDNEEFESQQSDNELDVLSDDGSEDEEIATEQLDAAKAAKEAAGQGGAAASTASTTGNKKEPEKKKRLSEHERRKALLNSSTSLPFETDSLEDFDDRLENIIQRLTECIETKDWSVGFAQWHHRLQCLLTLKYPIKTRTQANLARIFYELAVTPNLPRWIASTAAKKFINLASDRKTYTPRLQLRWRPLFDAIQPFLAPKARAVSLGSGVGSATTASGTTDTVKTGILLDLALHANWYFISEASYARSQVPAEAGKEDDEPVVLDADAPDIVDEMLDTFLPLMDGSDIDSVIRVQSLLVHFLPISHPQKWLPAMFRLWESFNSSLFTDQMLDLLARLSTYHVTDPALSSDKMWKFRNGDWIAFSRKMRKSQIERDAATKDRAEKEKKAQDETVTASGAEGSDQDVEMAPVEKSAEPKSDTAAGRSDADKTAAQAEEDIEEESYQEVVEEIDRSVTGGDDEDNDADQSVPALKIPPSVADNGAPDASQSQGKKQSKGLSQDIGIFTTEQFELIMTELLRSCGLPVGSKTAGKGAMITSGSGRTGVDATASRGTLGMKKPTDRMSSFATIIALSLAEDGPKAGMGISEVPTDGTATPTAAHPVPTTAQQGKQTTLAVPGMPAVAGRQTYLAGSRALDSIARFIQATETFFHPSNWGLWQMRMSSFLYTLSWQVLRRVKTERKYGGTRCRTPVHLRITEEIETEFVLCLRTVCLLSMFSKDPVTISRTQGTLRNLSLMKPELIFPAVLERSYSSLEALETTHRTTAVITALGSLAYPLLSRENYAAGAQHLVPLLHLCIPGIDLNDPLKTMSTALFVSMSMGNLRIDDMTRPELEDTGGTPEGMDIDRPSSSKTDGATEETPEISEEVAIANDAVRLSTSQFEDWIIHFFNSVIRVYEALPEEGRGGRQGGLSEERVVLMLNSTCEVICQALSDYMFDIAFKIVYKQCTTTTSPNSVKHLGNLVACFARADGQKVLDQLLPVCVKRIREELDHGASSTRTTSTSTPLDSDTALHHYLSVLYGALSGEGRHLLPHKKTLISLLSDVSERCRSERGYVFVSRLYSKIFSICCQIYPLEYRFVNPSTWNDPKFQREAHLWWGKTYSVKEVEVSWHTPSEEEIDFVVGLLAGDVGALLDKIEVLLAKAGSERDKVWSNDFCRYLTHARAVFDSIPSLIKLEEAGGGAPVTDCAPEAPGFVQIPPRFRSGFILTDPKDERYQKVLAFRERFGDLMLTAAKTSRGSSAEDQIDCVKQVIRSIQTYLSSYAYSETTYRHCVAALRSIRRIAKLHGKQTKFPRKLWIRKIALHQVSVARLNSFHRKRSAKDDELIAQILEYSLSDYVGIRKRAQKLLKSVSGLYDGTRTLCWDKLLDSLKPATADDQMKGALHVLSSPGFFRHAFDDDGRLLPYLEAMLAAQYRAKPSIQKLVKSIVNSCINSFPEIMTIDASPATTDLQNAIAQARASLSDKVDKASEDLLIVVRQKADERRLSNNQLFDTLLPRMLEIINAKETHWAYALFGARVLRALTRKDRPLNKEIVEWAAKTMTHENPKMRRYALLTLSKNLYYLKLRTLSKSEADLAQQKISNPFKRSEAIPDPLPADWVNQQLKAFAEGELTPETHLFDKTGTGWLVLPSHQTYYVVPSEEKDAIRWEEASQPSMSAIQKVIFDKEWWSKVISQASQEKDRNYLSSEAMLFIKGAFQIYGIALLPFLQEEVEKNIEERDRHKHRAAAEIICAMLRGSKHWVLADQKQVWSWFLAQWPAIVKACSPDSLAVWLMAIESILYRRDPHRTRPLIDLIVARATDSIKTTDSDQSPWEQAKAQNFLRSVLLSLQSKFTVWAPEFVDLYCLNIGHDFQEVRSILSESLADLDLLGTAPNFANTKVFLEACSQGRGSMLSKSDLYEARLDQLAQNLRSWRAERVPTAVGPSQYDRASLTTLRWIQTTLVDHRNSAIAGQTIKFLPEIFSMVELLDNAELSSEAKRALKAIAVYPFTADLISPLIRKLVDLIRSSHDSWRIRLDVLPILQIVYFRNLFYLSPEVVQEVNSLLLELLQDAHLEVREMASTTLSGIIRCSQRGMIRQLKERFTRQVQSIQLPKRDAADYQEKLLQLHGGILGVVALLSASPYTVPDWMPELIVDTVAAHTDDPVPISTTVRRCAASWKATHQDTWHEEKGKFTEEQLEEVTEWTLGRSDYFV